MEAKRTSRKRVVVMALAAFVLAGSTTAAALAPSAGAHAVAKRLPKH